MRGATVLRFAMIVAWLCAAPSGFTTPGPDAAAGPSATSGPGSLLSLGLAVAPDLGFAIGPRADYYRTAYGGRVNALLGFDRLGCVAPRVDLSYRYVPVEMDARATVSLVRASVGPQLTATFGERFSLYGYASAGGYYGVLHGAASATGGHASLHAGLGVGFQLFEDVTLGLGADYDAYLGTYDAVSIVMGVTTRLSGPGGGAVPLRTLTTSGSVSPLSGLVRVSNVELDTVFPVLRKYYDAQPVGRATIENTGERPMERVEVRLVPSAYIDSPKLSARIDVLPPGERRTVELYALFNEEILSVSEGAKIVTDVRVSYRIGERAGSDSETVTLSTYDRNALRWDDDRKIAAFVTAKDDEVQRFAKNIASLANEGRIDAVNAELQLAIAQFAGLREHGLTYVVDPTSSYEVLSDNPLAIDYVQFPRQTLYVKAGDCDDLSATYCAMLESVGIPTAFITVPGHIYTAFRLDTTPERARRDFSNPADLIVLDDGVWVPVETTLLGDGFLQAWSEGARQWRTHDADGRAELIRTHTAWSTYAPVAFSVSTIELGMPDRTAVLTAFRTELESFVTREVYPREQRLLSQLRARPNDPRLRNSLGVLYGRYGRYDQAKEQFELVLRREQHVPSMINLANVHYLAGDLPRAARAYEDALMNEPDNTAALLGLARVEHERENFGSAREAYAKLARLDAALAERFAYLDPDGAADGESRANDAGRLRTAVEWEER